MAPPKAPRPHFSRHVKPRTSPRKDGHISLRFWVPKGYCQERKLGPNGKQYPVVVVFHGGGFTLGEAMDDARWAGMVVDEVGAVVVGVDYRRAPEHPFPTAVEDGVDAILWLAKHAAEYNLDVDRIAVSGFSAGGNMAFTVPLRLQEEAMSGALTTEGSIDSVLQKALAASGPTATAAAAPATTTVTTTPVALRREVSIRAIVSWYPSTDYTQSREQRKATSVRPDQQLSATFSSLFDESYLQPPTLDLGNPYLSPGRAPPHMLAGLPDDVVLFTCEWDMLRAEGERLRDRLVDEQGKRVAYHCVPGVPHAWDKAPNPLRVTPGVYEHYMIACNELNRVFGTKD